MSDRALGSSCDESDGEMYKRAEKNERKWNKDNPRPAEPPKPKPAAKPKKARVKKRPAEVCIDQLEALAGDLTRRDMERLWNVLGGGLFGVRKAAS